MKLAIFDIDGTITHRSSERAFIKYLIRCRAISYTRLMVTALRFIVKHPTQIRNGFKQNKMYLRGARAEALRLLAEDCFEKKIKPDIKLKLASEIRDKRNEGYSILLLSGSIRFLVEPMARLLQADHIVCSETEIVEGAFTGELTSLHPYGQNKKILAIQFCRDHGFEMSTATAYANEFNDRFLLNEVAIPIAVHPDSKLRTLATKKKWTILE